MYAKNPNEYIQIHKDPQKKTTAGSEYTGSSLDAKRIRAKPKKKDSIVKLNGGNDRAKKIPPTVDAAIFCKGPGRLNFFNFNFGNFTR